MSTPINVDELIGVEIFLCNDMTHEEIDLLIQQEEIGYLARQEFIKGTMCFEDYLDTLEAIGCDMDNYTDTLKEDLIIIGAM